MKAHKRITREQQLYAYREAVQGVLEAFYDVSARRAEEIVSSWWESIVETTAWSSGLLLHSEAMNTAADLIDKEVIPITQANRDRYDQVLEKGLSAARVGKSINEYLMLRAPKAESRGVDIVKKDDAGKTVAVSR